MNFVFSGVVEQGDEYRGANGHDKVEPGAIHIGGDDVVREFYEEADDGTEEVVVVINRGELVLEGELHVRLGVCDRDWVPIFEDRLEVGDVDLLSKLRFFLGEEIEVVVSDEIDPEEWRV